MRHGAPQHAAKRRRDQAPEATPRKPNQPIPPTKPASIAKLQSVGVGTSTGSTGGGVPRTTTEANSPEAGGGLENVIGVGI